jgi:hypothetical protein
MGSVACVTARPVHLLPGGCLASTPASAGRAGGSCRAGGLGADRWSPFVLGVDCDARRAGEAGGKAIPRWRESVSTCPAVIAPGRQASLAAALKPARSIAERSSPVARQIKALPSDAEVTRFRPFGGNTICQMLVVWPGSETSCSPVRSEQTPAEPPPSPYASGSRRG